MIFAFQIPLFILLAMPYFGSSHPHVPLGEDNDDSNSDAGATAELHDLQEETEDKAEPEPEPGDQDTEVKSSWNRDPEGRMRPWGRDYEDRLWNRDYDGRINGMDPDYYDTNMGRPYGMFALKRAIRRLCQMVSRGGMLEGSEAQLIQECQGMRRNMRESGFEMLEMIFSNESLKNLLRDLMREE